jgi:hypothetical protein
MRTAVLGLLTALVPSHVAKEKSVWPTIALPYVPLQ